MRFLFFIRSLNLFPDIESSEMTRPPSIHYIQPSVVYEPNNQSDDMPVPLHAVSDRELPNYGHIRTLYEATMVPELTRLCLSWNFYNQGDDQESENGKFSDST